MLDIILILLIIMAFIIMLYSISEKNIAFCLIDSFLWLITALLMVQGVEIPYQLYNASSTAITTGTHVIQTNLDPLSYLFMGIGTIMFILFVVFAMEYYTDYKKIK